MVSAPAASILRSTTLALLAPKRALPILLVCATLLAAQGAYSREPWALPLGALMCLVSVAIGPVSWRVLFPEGLDLRNGAIRVGLYIAVAAGVILTVGVAIPYFTGMRGTFLTDRYALMVCCALFVVGGWGLGRDIGFEASLLRERRRAEALEREADRAQLLALRSHLDPHFLFNTLNAIAEWCRQDGAVAERAVLQLSEMLRTVLEGVKVRTWSIEQELELVRTLFSLHLMRDPELFELDWQVDPAVLGAQIPPMLLMPLAENAVKHGPASGHRGPLTLRAVRAADTLTLELSNPGAYGGPRPGSDGLPTFEKRLKLAYERAARFRIASEGDRTVARVELPMSGPHLEAA